MKHFKTIEKIDTGILYILEFVSSISVLLLAFGLIASMANVLTKGAVLTDHLWMQQVWAWTQCIAIDASVVGTIIRSFRFELEGQRVKSYLNGILALFLLFTAAIVSNIEAVQQTLNTSLNQAYLHVHVPIEVLIWIRSLAIVLLIVVHALDHVQLEKIKNNPSDSLQLTPELISELQVLLTKISLAETPSETVQIPQTTGMAETQETAETQQTQEIAGEGIVSRCDLLLTVSARRETKCLTPIPRVSPDGTSAAI